MPSSPLMRRGNEMKIKISLSNGEIVDYEGEITWICKKYISGEKFPYVAHFPEIDKKIITEVYIIDIQEVDD